MCFGLVVVLFIVEVLGVAPKAHAVQTQCPTARIPDESSHGENFGRNGKPLYKLTIEEKSDHINQSKTYTLRLQGQRHKKFRDVVLVVEAENKTCGTGYFLLSSSDLYQPSGCPHVITTNIKQKMRKASFDWTAPDCGCVLIRAVVHSTKGVYYSGNSTSEGDPLTVSKCFSVDVKSKNTSEKSLRLTTPTEVTTALDVQGNPVKVWTRADKLEALCKSSAQHISTSLVESNHFRFRHQLTVVSDSRFEHIKLILENRRVDVLDCCKKDIPEGMSYLREATPDGPEPLVDYFDKTYVSGSFQTMKPPSQPDGTVPAIKNGRYRNDCIAAIRRRRIDRFCAKGEPDIPLTNASLGWMRDREDQCCWELGGSRYDCFSVSSEKTTDVKKDQLVNEFDEFDPVNDLNDYSPHSQYNHSQNQTDTTNSNSKRSNATGDLPNSKLRKQASIISDTRRITKPLLLDTVSLQKNESALAQKAGDAREDTSSEWNAKNTSARSSVFQRKRGRGKISSASQSKSDSLLAPDISQTEEQSSEELTEMKTKKGDRQPTSAEKRNKRRQEKGVFLKDGLSVLATKAWRANLKVDCCSQGREKGKGEFGAHVFSKCMHRALKYSEKISRGKILCSSYFMMCCVTAVDKANSPPVTALTSTSAVIGTRNDSTISSVLSTHVPMYLCVYLSICVFTIVCGCLYICTFPLHKSTWTQTVKRLTKVFLRCRKRKEPQNDVDSREQSQVILDRKKNSGSDNTVERRGKSKTKVQSLTENSGEDIYSDQLNANMRSVTTVSDILSSTHPPSGALKLLPSNRPRKDSQTRIPISDNPEQYKATMRPEKGTHVSLITTLGLTNKTVVEQSIHYTDVHSPPIISTTAGRRSGESVTSEYDLQEVGGKSRMNS